MRVPLYICACVFLNISCACASSSLKGCALGKWRTVDGDNTKLFVKARNYLFLSKRPSRMFSLYAWRLEPKNTEEF